MDLCEWINNFIEDVNNGWLSFTQAANIIAIHPKLSIVENNNKQAVFAIDSIVQQTQITVQNKYYKKEPSPQAVLNEICMQNGITPETLKTKCRKRELAEIRHAYFIISMDLLNRNLINTSLADIGALVNRDHATVMHARKNSHLKSIKKMVEKSSYIN